MCHVADNLHITAIQNSPEKCSCDAIQSTSQFKVIVNGAHTFGQWGNEIIFYWFEDVNIADYTNRMNERNEHFIVWNRTLEHDWTCKIRLVLAFQSQRNLIISTLAFT